MARFNEIELDNRWSRPRVLFAYLLMPWFAILLIALVTTKVQDFQSLVDGWVYLGMSNPEETAQKVLRHRPWSLRVLSPAIVRFLVLGTGVDHLTGFYVLHCLGHWINLVLLVEILRFYSIPYGAVVLGEIFYIGVYWTIKWSFFSPGYIESGSIFFIFFATWKALRRDFATQPLIFMLGSFQKESFLFIAPFITALKVWPNFFLSQTGCRYLLVLVVPSLAVIGFLDRVIPELGGHYVPESLIKEVIVTYYLDLRWYPRLLLTPWAGLGVMPWILIWGRRRVVQFIKQHPSWIVLVLCGLPPLVCGWDVSRYYIVLLLPAILLSSYVLSPWVKSSSYRHKLALGVFIAVHFFIQNQFTKIITSEDFYLYTRPETSKQSIFLVSIFFLGSLVMFLAKLYGDRDGCFDLGLDENSVVQEK